MSMDSIMVQRVPNMIDLGKKKGYSCWLRLHARTHVSSGLAVMHEAKV